MKTIFFFQRDWAEGFILAAEMNFKFPQFVEMPIQSIVRGASQDGCILLKDLLRWNPDKRPTAVMVCKKVIKSS